MNSARWRDVIHLAAAVATILAAAVAALALWQSANAFKEQTRIQADQAAHNAVQEHMRLRVETPKIGEIERKLANSPNSIDGLAPDEQYVYASVGYHGIPMAEYVYKLTDDDPGWRATVESWVAVYRPLLLGRGLLCELYALEFVQVVEEALDTSRTKFCTDQGGSNIQGGSNMGLLLLAVVSGLIILVVVYLVLAARRA
jgi:hypothetical protein